MKMLKLFGFCLFVGLSANLCFSAVRQVEPSKEFLNQKSVYKSVFISPQGNLHEAGVYLFRNTFELKDVPQELAINITGDNKYALFVNGKFACRGSASGDYRNWYIDTVDIASFLKKGKNVVAVRIVNMGASRPASWFSNGTGLWIQANSGKYDFLNTEVKNWKYIKENSTLFPSRYCYAVASEHVDAHKFVRGWANVDFDDSKWLATFEYYRPHDISFYGEIVYQLKPRAIPMLEETPIRLAKVCEVEGLSGKTANDVKFISGEAFEIPANTSCKILLDMGHLTNAYTILETLKGANAEISISYAESMAEPKNSDWHGKKNRNATKGLVPASPLVDKYILDGKATTFEALDFRTFRYVQFDIKTSSEPLVIKDYKATFTGYPFVEKAKFASSDKSLEKIWEVGWRTQRLCAVDRFYDCPSYERLMYVGDTRIQTLISLYVSGDWRLYRRAIELFDQSRQAEGLTQARYPSNVTQYIQPFSLYWVNMIHDYYMHTPDTEFVGERLNGIETVLNWFATQLDKKTGMLKAKMYGWSFVDWVVGWEKGVPPETDKSGSAIISLHYAIALADAAELMDVFGRKDVALRYRKMSQDIKANTYKRCWNQKRGLLSDAEGIARFSQHANIMGILSNAIPADKQEEVFMRIVKEAKNSYAPHKADDVMEATFYYKFYLFRAMNKLGKGDMFLDMLKPWHDMLAIGLTTFAENPEPTRSDCHAWSASPVYEFMATVCGINPMSPAFKTVRIAPKLGKLTFAKASMPHPSGTIDVDFKRGKNLVSCMQKSLCLRVFQANLFGKVKHTSFQKVNRKFQ